MNGYPLDILNPQTHNQRIVHKMLTEKNPLLTITSDKVKVQDYIRERLGANVAKDLLIPIYHISKTGMDIPVPPRGQEFFMKANHASGFNKLINADSNPTEIQKLAKYWLSQSFGQVSHAWAYRDIPRRILCEKVLRDENGSIPMDIKFYCFHGKVKMILFLKDRFNDASRIFTDENLREIPGAQMFGDKKLTPIPVHQNLEEMKKLSEKLAQDFNYCRVDLYSIQGKIYFGEITHYTGAGIERFDDYATDLALGQLWLPENKDKSIFQILEAKQSLEPTDAIEFS